MSRYYLIEVPFDMAPDGIRKRLLEFPAMGKIPVLAHPERWVSACGIHRSFYTNSGKWARFCRSTKGSVFGRFGEEAERTARFLLENRLAAVWQAMPTEPITTTDMRPVRQFLEEAVWRSVCTAF